MPVVELLPVGNGAFSAWTPFPAGTPHWQSIFDPVGSDDDATFLHSSDDTQRAETMRFESAPDLPRVHPVSWLGLKARLRRTVPGELTVSFASRLYSAGVLLQGPTVLLGAGATAWTTYDPAVLVAWRFPLDPASGAPWTYPAALLAELGIVDLTFDDGAGGVHDLRWTLARKSMNVNYWGVPAVRGPAHGGPRR